MPIERTGGINRRRFLLSAILGTTSCISARANRQWFNQAHARRQAQETNENCLRQWQQKPQLSRISSKEGDFFIWFNIHGFPIQLDLKTVQAITHAHPYLIYVPENVVEVDSPSKLRQELLHNRSWQEFLYEDFFGGKDKPFSSGVLRHLFQRRTSVFQLDAIYNSSIKPMPKTTANNLFGYSRSILWGLLASYKASKLNLNRRELLTAFAFFGAGVVDGLLTGGDDYQTRWFKFVVDLRNALFAFKLLHLAAEYQRRQNIRPAFLGHLGICHRGIENNLRMGMRYNLDRINDLCEELGLNRSNLPDTIYQGFLFDPNTAEDVSIVHPYTFEDLLSAIPKS